MKAKHFSKFVATNHYCLEDPRMKKCSEFFFSHPLFPIRKTVKSWKRGPQNFFTCGGPFFFSKSAQSIFQNVLGQSGGFPKYTPTSMIGYYEY